MMANHCVRARSADSNLIGFIGVFRFTDKKRNGLAFCAWVLIVPVKRPDCTAAVVRSCVTPISNWKGRLKIIRLQSITIILLLPQIRVSLHTFLLLSDVSTATPSHYVTVLAPKFQNKSTSKKSLQKSLLPIKINFLNLESIPLCWVAGVFILYLSLKKRWTNFLIRKNCSHTFGSIKSDVQGGPPRFAVVLG